MAELGTYYITIMPDMSQFTGAGPDMGGAQESSDGPAADDVVDGDFKEV